MKKSRWGRFVALSLLALPLLMASDCTGSEPLRPANGTVVFGVSNVNIGDNRFIDDPFGDFSNFILPDFAGIQVVGMHVEPLDPDAAAAAPSLPIEVIGVPPFDSDWAFAPSLALESILSDGPWRLTRLDLGVVLLEDNSDGMGGTMVQPSNWADPSNPTCQDFVRGFNYSDLVLVDFGEEVTFDVTASGTGLVAVIDVPAFLDAVYQTTSCANCPCPALYDDNDPSTLDCECDFFASFNVQLFRQLAPTYLHFE